WATPPVHATNNTSATCGSEAECMRIFYSGSHAAGGRVSLYWGEVVIPIAWPRRPRSITQYRASKNIYTLDATGGLIATRIKAYSAKQERDRPLRPQGINRGQRNSRQAPRAGGRRSAAGTGAAGRTLGHPSNGQSRTHRSDRGPRHSARWIARAPRAR